MMLRGAERPKPPSFWMCICTVTKARSPCSTDLGSVSSATFLTLRYTLWTKGRMSDSGALPRTSTLRENGGGSSEDD
jgi:hypothetical protein